MDLPQKPECIHWAFGCLPLPGERPLIYRPQGTNWLLYSVGEDRVDDGGRPVGRSSAAQNAVTKGDIFYDSPY